MAAEFLYFNSKNFPEQSNILVINQKGFNKQPQLGRVPRPSSWQYFLPGKNEPPFGRTYNAEAEMEGGARSMTSLGPSEGGSRSRPS